MSTETDGTIGLKLTSLDWLTAHHEAKRQERDEMVAIHGIVKGEHVLDIACGPGFWTPLLNEAVGPGGMVTGLDMDPSLITLAKAEHGDLIAQGRAAFHVGDMRSLPYEDGAFDVVLCGNAYNYLSADELPGVINEHLRVVRPGGRLSARAFDNTVTLFHPVPPTLLLSVLQGVAKSLEEDRSFDNYLGQKLHGLFVGLDVGRVDTHTVVTQKTQPLCSGTRAYVRMKALWYADRAQGHCPAEDLAAWRTYFDTASPGCILDRADVYFATTEMITTVVKPLKSAE